MKKVKVENVEPFKEWRARAVVNLQTVSGQVIPAGSIVWVSGGGTDAWYIRCTPIGVAVDVNDHQLERIE